MKIVHLLSAAVFVLLSFSASQAQDGEKLFKSNCASCHAFGKKLVGPDLTGVTDKREEQWLHKWIKSSQTMVREGDPVAIQVFNEGNKIPMPDAFINDEEIKAVIGFMKTRTGAEQVSAPTSAPVAQAAPVVVEADSTLLTMFSFTEYLLLGLLVLFLIIIWMMARTIKELSQRLQ